MVPQLFLAFDNLREKPAESFADMEGLAESGEPFDIKFNLDSMVKPRGDLMSLVERLRQFRGSLFADLKMWNGKRTMETLAKTFVDLGVDYINAYALADKELEKAVKATEGSNTKVLGLTVLSHYNDAYCRKWFGRTLLDAVKNFSFFALEAGCHGVILPGTMLGEVADLSTIKVATGLRPTWYRDNRHGQEATPTDVVLGGATFAVCGSPVLKQPTIAEKISALKRIREEMAQAAV